MDRIEITPALLEQLHSEVEHELEVQKIYWKLLKIHKKPVKTIMEKERFSILARELIVHGGKV